MYPENVQADGKKPTRRSATARSEAGSGTTYQQDVSAFLLSQMACESHSYSQQLPGEVQTVRLQASDLQVPFDDQVVTVSVNGQSVRHLISCKINVNAIASNTVFADLWTRLYRAAHGQYLGLQSSDRFVIACSECVKSVALKELLGFAKHSENWDDLSSKLRNEAKDRLELLQHICSAVVTWVESDENVANLDFEQEQILWCLQRTVLWKNGISEQHSYERSFTITQLEHYCDSRDVAEKLYEKIRAWSPKLESYRATITREKLLSEYPEIREPTEYVPRANSDANRSSSVNAVTESLSAEFLDALEEDVLDLQESMQTRRTYESLQKVDEMFQKHLVRLVAAASSEIASSTRLKSIGAKMQKVRGNAMLRMGFHPSHLRAWIDETTKFLPGEATLAGTVCRIAVQLEDSSLFDSWFGLIESSDEQRLLQSQWKHLKGETEEALAHAESVQGTYRADALLMKSVILLERSDRTVESLVGAVESSREALQILPDRVVLSINYASYLVSMLQPCNEAFYLSGGPRDESAHRYASEAIEILESVIENEECGLFEVMMASIVRQNLLQLIPTVPAYVSNKFEGIAALASLQEPGKVRFAAHFLQSVSQPELALRVLENLLTSGGDDDVTETKRMMSAITGGVTPENILPKTFFDPLSKQAALRDAYYSLLNDDPDEAILVASHLVSSENQSAFTLEISILEAIREKDEQKATEHFEELRLSYPNATSSWHRLLYFVHSYRTDYFSSEAEPGLRDLAFGICQTVCDVYPSSWNFGCWVECALVSKQNVANQLDQIACSASESAQVYSESLARALASEVRLDFKAAVKHFRDSLAVGQLSSSLAGMYSKCLLYAGEFDELISNRFTMLERKRRHPGEARATVFALKNGNRLEEMIEVAKSNSEDFPDEPVAAKIFIDACVQAGRMDLAIPEMQRFSEEHPEDSSYRLVEFDDEFSQFFEMMEQRRAYNDGLLEAYQGCQVPLTLFPGGVAKNYLWFLSENAGLQTRRSAYQLPSFPIFESDRSIALETTAILTLARFGLFDVAEKITVRLLVPDFVVNRLRNELVEMKLQSDPPRVNAWLSLQRLLGSPKVRIVRSLTELDAAFGPTEDEDEVLARLKGLVKVNHRDEGAFTLRGIVRIAKELGVIGGIRASAIDAQLRDIAPVGEDTKPTEFPSAILIDDETASLISGLQNPAEVLDLFDSVWIGPPSIRGIGMQFGQLHHELEATELLESAIESVDRLASESRLVIASTNPLGDVEEMNYVRELDRFAQGQSALVWTDDLATRRFLAGLDPPVPSFTSLDLLEQMSNAQILNMQQVKRWLLELGASGYRDVTWFEMSRWESEVPNSTNWLNIIVRRLGWQSESSFHSAAERELYLHSLIINVVGAAELGFARFCELHDEASKYCLRDISTLDTGVITVLQASSSDDALECAWNIATTGSDRGTFDLRKWCIEQQNRHARISLDPKDYSLLSLRTQFEYWFRANQKLSKLMRDSRTRKGP